MGCVVLVNKEKIVATQGFLLESLIPFLTEAEISAGKLFPGNAFVFFFFHFFKSVFQENPQNQSDQDDHPEPPSSSKVETLN